LDESDGLLIIVGLFAAGYLLKKGTAAVKYFNEQGFPPSTGIIPFIASKIWAWQNG